MATPDRHIRVFISSTFRDMQEERDYLVKYTFPQLRKLCESRGVVWGEVDLRWGITDEEQAEGQVLPVCLEEIQRCRPYFIGLLGERYGWIPEQISDDLIERQPWLNDHRERSVTELEMLYGVLRKESMQGQAFFYFRDPTYLDRLPVGTDPSRFKSESPDAQKKLDALKHRLRQAQAEGNCLVREPYPDPKTLGAWILEDFTALINERFPEGSQLDPLDRDALDHEAFAQSRARVYIGRQEYIDRLDAHVASDGPPLVLLGDSGSGKSALLANWFLGYQQAHPEMLSIIHFIGATPASTDWAAMLRRIMGELKQWLGITQDIPDHPDALRNAFPNWLHMAAAKSRVLLLLDGLNQLENRDGAPDLLWLPPVIPENLRLIISTLPGRALDEITKRHWSVFKIEPLSVAERKELIRQFLRDYGRTLSPARVDRITATPQSANPLYLRVLLNELRLFGQHDRLESRISYYLDAASPYELYEKVIARWEQDYEGDTDLVGDMLSLLWAAQHGLTESELLDALGHDGLPLPHATWSPLFLAMVDAFVNRGGLLTFAHDFLRTATRDAYLPAESHQQQAHIRLADYFDRQLAGPRQTDELPWQLAEAQAWPRLSDLLIKRQFFIRSWDKNKFEVETYWARIEKMSSIRMVEAYRPNISKSATSEDVLFLSRLDLLLDSAGHVKEAIRLRSMAIEVYRNAKDEENLSRLLSGQGLFLMKIGRRDEAMVALKEAEVIARKLNDNSLLEPCLHNQAVLLQTAGQLSEAMMRFQEQEKISRAIGDRSAIASSLSEQAIILWRWGNLAQALELLRQVERISREVGDRLWVSVSLGHQALILADLGRLGEAMDLLTSVEHFARECGNKHSLALCLGNQAEILRHQDKLDDSLALYKTEEQLCRELEDPDSLQASLHGQAVILYAWGQVDEAMRLHKESEQLCRQLGKVAGLQASFVSQALILKKCGDLDGAMALLKEAERICHQMKAMNNLQHCLGIQALVLMDRGNLDSAMVLLKEQERIARQLGELDGLQASLGNQALILGKRGDLEGAMQLLKEQEPLCRELGNPKGLAISWVNQARTMTQQGKSDEGRRLAQEAYQLAMQHGLTALAQQIAPIVQQLGGTIR